jgi:ABC-2 type transport system permease protein
VSEGELSDKLTELEDGDLRAVVVIPADIEASIAAGRAVAITVYHDPSQTASAQIILPVLRQIVGEINQQLTQQPVLLTLTEESILSQNLRFIDFFVPGILAMSIMMTGFFGVVPLIEWREKKVLKRLGVTPLRRSTVVLSQVALRLVLTVLQAIILLGVAYFAFDVQVIGNWFMLFGLLLLGTLSFISIGYLVASRARTVESAMPIINLITFPMMFLSGIFFPVEMMPDFMRPVVEAFPLTYLGDALRQIMVDAPPLHSLTTNIVVLGGWFIVCMALAIRFFRWE